MDCAAVAATSRTCWPDSLLYCCGAPAVEWLGGRWGCGAVETCAIATATAAAAVAAVPPSSQASRPPRRERAGSGDAVPAAISRSSAVRAAA
jgi:hypothetical protein